MHHQAQRCSLGCGGRTGAESTLPVIVVRMLLGWVVKRVPRGSDALQLVTNARTFETCCEERARPQLAPDAMLYEPLFDVLRQSSFDTLDVANLAHRGESTRCAVSSHSRSATVPTACMVRRSETCTYGPLAARRRRALAEKNDLVGQPRCVELRVWLDRVAA
jgi:hypothetical protein